MNTKKKRIIIFAHIPPPYHGASIMQKYLVDCEWDWCYKESIVLRYSDQIHQIGSFNLKKGYLLFVTLFRIIKSRFKSRIDICYYPPALTGRLPFYRDLISILLIKMTCEQIVYHFHAGGALSFYNRISGLEKLLARRILGNVSFTIALLPQLVDELKFLNAANYVTIPNGIPDNFNKYKKSNLTEKRVRILYLGNLLKDKGIFDLLESVNILKNFSGDFVVRFVGSWESESVKKSFYSLINKYNIEALVEINPSRTDDSKYQEYADADIFCFPSFYEVENQPLVLLEAMMFSLPIITTSWRALPDIISDGEDGLLAPINSPDILAEKLFYLIGNKEERRRLGLNARKKYLNEYTIEKHLNLMERLFRSIAGEKKW
ncbi:MAG TPA: glycosyltransferase family 4 protein [Melioribacteraceae bacterium]|nr:glycosyltransferase family 4 protein [Melioribacteraceae bacterium]